MYGPSDWFKSNLNIDNYLWYALKVCSGKLNLYMVTLSVGLYDVYMLNDPCRNPLNGLNSNHFSQTSINVAMRPSSLSKQYQCTGCSFRSHRRLVVLTSNVRYGNGTRTYVIIGD